MFDETLTLAALVVLAMICAGGVAYGLLYSSVQNEAASAKRLNSITDRAGVIGERKAVQDLGVRKKNIQDALKEFEANQKAKVRQVNKPPLSLRIQQAGLKWTMQTFYIFSVVCGLVFGGLAFVMSGKIVIMAGAALIGGLGLPRWFIGYRRKRRMAKFLDELPNAVDVIVRGIKSGLPLGDCLRIIAQEATEPVKSEFRYIVETQQVGVTIGDAVMKLYERVPVSEANFFGIVIAIQSKAGGNLSEALGNLSSVLRDRKKMKAKISAMSMEAKASAGIIGALPIIVSALVYLTSPNYIAILFISKTGNLILLASLLYMFIGILVMRKMINFDF